MRTNRLWALTALLLPLAACDAPAGPETRLTVAGAPGFEGVVASVHYESGNTPVGPMSQYNVWLTLPPTAGPNAGVVVTRGTPVFLQQDGVLLRTTASQILPGDSIQVWHDASVAYGAVEAPPGSPCYVGTQIVIVR